MLGYKVPLQVIEDYENYLKRLDEKVQPNNEDFKAFCDGVHDAFAEVRMCELVNLDSNWHTDIPTKKGWYVCKMRGTDLYETHYFTGVNWDEEIIEKWQMIEEEESNGAEIQRKTPKRFAKEMKYQADQVDGDTRVIVQGVMIDLMCDMLVLLGYGEGVMYYRDIFDPNYNVCFGSLRKDF